MGKFENSLVKSFNPALQSGARSGVQAFLQRQRMDADANEKFQEYMRKEQEKQKKQIGMTNVLTRILDKGYTPTITDAIEMGQYDITPKEREGIYNMLYPNDKIGNNSEPESTYLLDEDIGERVVSDNVYNQKRAVFGYPDPKGNYEVDGKKYTVTKFGNKYDVFKRAQTKEEIGDKGEKGKIIGYSNETRKMFADNEKEMLRLGADLELLKGGKDIPVYNKDGEVEYLSPDQVNEKYHLQKNRYAQYVKSVLPKKGIDWYKKAYDTVTDVKEKGNPHPEDYIENLMDDYLHQELGADEIENQISFLGLVELFKATYGFSPTQIEPSMRKYFDVRF